MSAYSEFVKAHIKAHPGEGFKEAAAAWKAQKSDTQSARRSRGTSPRVPAPSEPLSVKFSRGHIRRGGR